MFLKLLPLVLLITSLNSDAKRIAETTIPDAIKCGDQTLTLQGAALRTATWLNIKVYIVAIYGKEKISKTTSFESISRPLCFEITYLRDVDNEDTDKAWAFQFKESSDFPYPALPEHVKNLQDFFGEIKGDRKHLFTLMKEKTTFTENGVLKGEILGPEFQKNFLSIWFGKNPPTKEVQEQLLKGI